MTTSIVADAVLAGYQYQGAESNLSIVNPVALDLRSLSLTTGIVASLGDLILMKMITL